MQVFASPETGALRKERLEAEFFELHRKDRGMAGSMAEDPQGCAGPIFPEYSKTIRGNLGLGPKFPRLFEYSGNTSQLSLVDPLP